MLEGGQQQGSVTGRTDSLVTAILKEGSMESSSCGILIADEQRRM